MSWWDKIGTADESAAAPARRSVYESRAALSAGDQDGEGWEPVGEIDPVTCRWTVPPQSGWLRRAQGWVPLGERFRGTDRW